MYESEFDNHSIFFDPGQPKNRADFLIASAVSFIFSALVLVISWFACLIEDFSQHRKQLRAPRPTPRPAAQAPVTSERPPVFTPAHAAQPLPYWTGSGVWPLPRSIGADPLSAPIHESTRPQHQARKQSPHP